MVLVSKGDKLCEVNAQATNGSGGQVSRARHADSLSHLWVNNASVPRDNFVPSPQRGKLGHVCKVCPVFWANWGQVRAFAVCSFLIAFCTE